MSPPVFFAGHCCQLLCPGSSTSYSSYNDTGISSKQSQISMLLPFPTSSIDDNNPALTTLFLLFRSLRRPSRNRHQSFRSHNETDKLVMCRAVRLHGHVSHIDKCWPEVDYSYTNTEYPSYTPTFFHPRRRVTVTPACTGYSYLNHHVISVSDHQWPIFQCRPFARAS